MNIQLVKGSYSVSDALELMSQLIQVKIKFQENKINATHNEEDIKMREDRIKQLQNDLHQARVRIEKKGGMIALESEITFLNQ